MDDKTCSLKLGQGKIRLYLLNFEKIRFFPKKTDILSIQYYYINRLYYYKIFKTNKKFFQYIIGIDPHQLLFQNKAVLFSCFFLNSNYVLLTPHTHPVSKSTHGQVHSDNGLLIWSQDTHSRGQLFLCHPQKLGKPLQAPPPSEFFYRASK